MARQPMRPDPTKPKPCRDCLAEALEQDKPLLRPRPAPFPGPRCATHHRAKKRANRERAHDTRVARTYTGMSEGDYAKILAEQDGLCAVCGPVTGARGATRKLALDHDHLMDWPYGLLCARCNQYLGFIRRSVNAAKRLVAYLEDPPAWRVLGPPPGYVPKHDRPPEDRIEELIDRSSLGTPAARSLAAKTPDEVARRIVARAEELASIDPFAGEE